VKVAVPSWRSDVHGKADIVEEVVRIYGVDKVPMTPFERGVRRGFASSEGLGRHWTGSAQADVFDAKADALAVLAAAGAPMQALQIVAGGPAWLHPGRSGTIQIGPQNVLGTFGEVHPRALEALGADGPLMVFEVILDRIPEAKKKPTRAKPVIELSAFQPVTRDFAFIVDRSAKGGDIVRAAQGVDKKLITGVNVFDVYEGKGIDDGKKSIAVAVTLQPREKTLTDQEIEAVAAKIVAEVTKKTGGTLRA
jgi:phenylalanyl-tRNA synthetase beta chain